MIRIFNSENHEKVSENFHSKEFACPCCGYALIDSELLIVCEHVRRLVNKPVKINSGYRCPAHNFHIGGASLSRHLLSAADLDWDGAEKDLANQEFKLKIVDIAHRTKLLGLGWGTGFIHVDCDQSRKTLTQWTY